MQRAPSSFRFPGGESFVEMQLRIVSTIERLRAAHPGGTIVCVSHADPIKAAIAHSIGTHLDLFQRIVISPASVSVLAFLTGEPDRPVGELDRTAAEGADTVVKAVRDRERRGRQLGRAAAGPACVAGERNNGRRGQGTP